MKVRILTATPLGGVILPGNSVPDLPKSLVKQLTDQGVGDSTPRAVAYAETLGVALPKDMPSFDAEGNVIDPHAPPAEPAAS